jgi:CDK inhibitor PHO81
LDYKFLKKIVSSLAANRPGSEAAVLALGIRPADILNTPSSPTYETHANTPTELWGRSATGITMMPDSDVPPILSAVRQDEDKGPDFQAHKAVFFFKLERELEKARFWRSHRLFL